jgi:putative sigma-54 modulation protein
MRLELTGRRLDITPALRRKVATKCAKLERMLNDSAVSAQVVLSVEKHRHCTDITLHARGERFLHGVADAGNWDASLSAAIDKLTNQAARLKGKWQARKRRGTGIRAVPETQVEAIDRAPVPRTGAGRPRQPRPIRAGRQAVKRMSVAEAVRAVGASRDGLVVFLDAETASINVLSRRPDGELTLVEIEL